MLIRADAVLPGGGAEAIRPGAVRIDDGLVAAVGPSVVLMPASDEDCVDLPGRTILPGLIDAHDHLRGDRRDASDPEAPTAVAIRSLIAGQECLRHLQQGVTGIRVLGCDEGLDVAVRSAIEAGLVDGPRVHSVGRAITAAGEESAMTVGVRDVAAARIAVAEQVAIGAQAIKLMGSGGIAAISRGADPSDAGLPPAVLLEAARAAHAAGLPVAVHAIGEASIEAALDAEADSIEHGIGLTPAQASRMARDGTLLVPTMSTYRRLAQPGDELGIPVEWSRAAAPLLETHAESVGWAIDAGVGIAVGSDGFGDLIEEIGALVGLGLDSLGAIDAACHGGARALGNDERLGLLRPGYIADLIVVWGRPDVDVAALADVDQVFLGGRSAWSRGRAQTSGGGNAGISSAR